MKAYLFFISLTYLQFYIHDQRPPSKIKVSINPVRWTLIPTLIHLINFCVSNGGQEKQKVRPCCLSSWFFTHSSIFNVGPTLPDLWLLSSMAFDRQVICILGLCICVCLSITVCLSVSVWVVIVCVCVCVGCDSVCLSANRLPYWD